MRYLTAICTALLVQGCASQDEGVVACRADLIENLKAPSTLQIVEAYRGSMPPITHADRIARIEQDLADQEARFEELSEAERFLLAYSKGALPEMRAENDPSTNPSYAILLTYDSENSFGAPIRDHFWCRIWVNAEHEDTVFQANRISSGEVRDTKAMMEAVSL